MKFTWDNVTSLRGRFFSSKEKIVDNFASPRNLVGERHVTPAIPVFLRGRPSSLREEVAKKENLVRYIIPPMVSPGQRRHVVQHKKFPQRLSKTQKRRMQRQREIGRRQLIEVPVKPRFPVQPDWRIQTGSGARDYILGLFTCFIRHWYIQVL